MKLYSFSHELAGMKFSNGAPFKKNGVFLFFTRNYDNFTFYSYSLSSVLIVEKLVDCVRIV